jgi:FG-GAP repeat
VRVAAGDVTGDGRADVIAGAGPGRTAAVRVFDGATMALLSETEPYGPYPAGLFVATNVPLNRMAVNPPAPGAAISGPFAVAGWAFEENASDAGIDAIHVWAFPIAGGPAQFLGVATIGIERPDVAALFGPKYLHSGFSMVAPALPAGTYDVLVFAHSSVSGTFNMLRIVRIVVTP